MDIKVYRAPDVDWSNSSQFSLELQEVGKPETSRNQILEEYLLLQVTECLQRIGYREESAKPAVKIRLYFGVKEEKIETNLTYGFSLTERAGVFNTRYPLAAGIWSTASIAATSWMVRSTTETTPVYVGEISVEVFDLSGTRQLWRGDVRANLSTDDIRTASNWMIRELLWRFPALDYPAVHVLELQPEEFNLFWNQRIKGREFYSPGQRLPVTLDFAGWKDTGDDGDSSFGYIQKEIDESNAAFEETAEGRRILKVERAKDPLTGAHSMVGTEARQEYRREVYDFPAAFEEWVRRNARNMVAVTDLLQTAPWSAKDSNGVVFAGRYFVGKDETCTTIAIKAVPITFRSLSKATTIYDYKKYYITTIWVMKPDDFRRKWKEVIDQREMAFGQMDHVPSEPSLAIRVQ
ncbi:DUF4136 domain-containing protein [candidate division KSB1 bacterium]|nr:DUF4136 domain-containing protein [candidate division KSB1 bacterium]